MSRKGRRLVSIAPSSGRKVDEPDVLLENNETGSSGLRVNCSVPVGMLKSFAKIVKEIQDRNSEFCCSSELENLISRYRIVGERVLRNLELSNSLEREIRALPEVTLSVKECASKVLELSDAVREFENYYALLNTRLMEQNIGKFERELEDKLEKCKIDQEMEFLALLSVNHERNVTPSSLEKVKENPRPLLRDVTIESNPADLDDFFAESDD